MSQRFDIKRFVQLVRHDLRSCPKEFVFGGLWMAVAFAPLMVLSQQYIGHDHIGGTIYRISMMVSMIAVESMMVPQGVYPNVGKKKRGIYFAMLPATKAEKHLSMATVAMVVTPVTLIAVGLAFDMLLTAVHLPGYDKYFWQAEAWHSFDFPMIAGIVVTFIGAVFASIYANAILHKGLRNFVSIVAMLWLVCGMIAAPTIFYRESAPGLYWAVIAVEAAMALLFAWLSRRKMDKLEY
ncbi:MAG: hypothetical protein ACSW8I_05240 [bacterium]